ncbi:MAG TPA: hypothetical protein VK897_09145 [Anaerolineales bacterium]|nr:hypothetical protein [Anaerolineales bacterium]
MKRFPFYLILFAVYPVLALWSQNIQEVGFSQIVRVLVASVLLALLTWLIVWLILRNREKAGLIAVVALIIFFSYGHLYESARGWSFELARHRYLLPLVIVLFLTWVVFMIRIRRVNRLTEFFNLFSLVLLVMPLYTIINYQVRAYASQSKQAATAIAKGTDQNRPDIYYIIVDGYGREDTLRDYYGFDNSAFINYLENKGFYVAKESTSNYRKTILSLTSSLNMNYIQDLLPGLNPKSKDYTEMFELLRHSTARKLLAENGYRMITVDNNIKTNIGDAEVFLVPDPLSLSERVTLSDEGYALDLNSFEGMFVETSLAKLWVDWQVRQGKSDVLNIVAVEAPYNRHRKYILFGIDSIRTAANMDGNNFVFIHIVAPHPPFVFGPNGEQVKHDRLFTIADGPYSQGSKEDYVRGYTGQVAFLNQQLMTAIDYVFEHSETEPIIILQGDHGPKGFSDENVENSDFTENFAILNAYYFPDQDYTDLYPSISPVNSLRILTNKFFGMDFPLLDDRSYFSDVRRPFDFIQVTDQVK